HGSTPARRRRFGTVTHDPGLRYVVARAGVDLVGPVVAEEPGLVLRRIDHHPWALRRATYGVSDDGWITGSSEDPTADGTYAYFGPERRAGTLVVTVGRPGFCSGVAPGTHATVRIGPMA